MLKFSIIVPSYNQGRFIEETIRSVIGQTYRNVELIVIDGGSKDNTLDVIKKYETAIKYWVSEKDSGQSEAINKGMKVANGDIVTWLNSDDYYERDTLERVAGVFAASPDVSLIHGKSVFFGTNIRQQTIGLEKDIARYEYLSYMRFPQPSSFIRKKDLEWIGSINDSLHYAMDYEMVARMVLRGLKIKRVDDVLAHYRLHEDSKSNNDRKFIDEWAGVLYSVFNSIPGGRAFAKKMEELKLVPAVNSIVFDCDMVLSNEELTGIFLSHLNLHYHYHYRAFHLNECKALSSYVQIHYPQRFVKDQYKKFNARLKFVPRSVFNLIRSWQQRTSF